MRTLFNIFILINVILLFAKCSDDSDYIEIKPSQLFGTWATMSMDTIYFIGHNYLEFKNSEVPERIKCNYELIEDTIIFRSINRPDNYLKEAAFKFDLKDINFLIIYGLFPKATIGFYKPDCNGYFNRVF